MYGFLGLPNTTEQRQWIYSGAGTNALLEYQVWHKPPNISFVFIQTFGPGGGGACPGPFTSSVAKNGGGGGAAGTQGSLLLPAWSCPDQLYIFAGRGGIAQSTPNTNGNSAGNNTYVRWIPTAPDGLTTMMLSIAGGVGLATGTQGTSTAPASSQLNISQTGIRSIYAGPNGGGSSANSTQQVTQVYRITGGAGGAGNSSANGVGGGNAIYGMFGYSLRQYSGVRGANDFSQFLFFGGSSPAASISVAASASSAGGYGCGGAGGSVGTTPGAGGAGGDGLVVITCM
jgi:hypothetical protein